MLQCTENFSAAVKENDGVELVACSGLLSPTVPAMKATVAAIKASGLTGIKVLVGGAPVTQAYADEIGADGYAADAGGATTMAKELIKTA